MMVEALGASALLAVWERARHQPGPERALTLLAAAAPGAATEDLLQLPVGERNARILRVRAGTLGDTLAALARCESCGEEAELSIAVADLLRASRAESQPSEQEIVVDGRTACFRLPTAGDLVAVARCADVAEARAMLLARCLIRHDDAAPTRGDFPGDVVAAIADRIMAVDPLAEIVLRLECPTCGTQWTTTLDVAEFVWAELSAEARRLLLEVHELATAYGWRESDILAMSAIRRHAYLELVGA